MISSEYSKAIIAFIKKDYKVASGYYCRFERKKKKDFN